ncbi:putative peptidoglycan binding protein [Nostoc sp. PCC 7524]|uniref:peptidoglycan-binding domain-containing protein n=1 Tax=Nostoc sp. (strain ATCC 29411 / PCC 7524) TaxID=28072 RepID=UPI00029ED739|nr:peptidoglycan-binding protein [Nostoc sp. PCC 7524]AFY48604.1 putative peptidoglycan binding protein [Nostoc sp. PCC 7524]
MWCGFNKSSMVIGAACLVTASVIVSNTTFAARQRNYTPQEFRAVLRGLGYNVKVTNAPLTDKETKAAISEFQKGYKLTVDGIAGPKTQDFAATIVQILQGNLNAVLKPKQPLPRDQFYSDRTEDLVKEYQKKHKLQETGIANLALRQKLDKEAKEIINQPGTKPSPTPTATPTSTPSPTPTATPTSTPSPTPTATPTSTPSPTPTATPTSTPSPTPTATPTSTPSPTPTATPTSTPSPTPTATP